MHLSNKKKDQGPQSRQGQWVDDGSREHSSSRLNRGGERVAGQGPPAGMNLQGILSIAAIVLGVVVLAVLTALGGVARQTIHELVKSRLEYEMPKGYDKDPNYKECYRSTEGKFYDEYYLWNLTNQNEFIAGLEKPHFNLTGPYVYTQWYCNYQHSIDKETGILRYRTTQEGYRFIRHQSAADEDVLITNINPAYLGALNLAGSESNLALMMSGQGLQTVIETLQAPPTILSLQLGAFNNINKQFILPAAEVLTAQGFAAGILLQLQAGGVPVALFFAPSFQAPPQSFGLRGWANYTLQINSTADVTLSGTSQNALYAAWTSPSTGGGLATFAGLTPAAVQTTYSVTADQATWLLAYVINYLRNPATYGPPVTAQAKLSMYGQWANGSLPSQLPGWELGKPTASGLSAADTATLFDETNNCSLAHPIGIQTWVKGMFGLVNVLDNCTMYTMTPQQYGMILQWIPNFTRDIGSAAVLGFFNLTTWENFGYEQWGNAVAGPLGSWPAEIKSFNPACAFTKATAMGALNGTTPLFDYTNLVRFMQLYLAAQYTTIADTWGVSPTQAACLAGYVQTALIPNGVLPVLRDLVYNGGGLVVTRNVNDWLFNAVDPLLALIAPERSSVPLVGNDTIDEAQAELLNYTHVRVYTGSNDLYWSLMPFNEGDELPFWNGVVTVTGYNGSQFLPYNEINNNNPGGHPLDLYHSLIKRPIPFINAGKDKWDGVNVRYLTLDPLALASDRENPVNQAYFAQYSGLVNMSKALGLPIFLSRADLHGSEPAVTENITFSDLIYADFDPSNKLSRHRLALFLLVEPELGTSVWGNLPIQINAQFKPTDIFYRNIQPGFAPIYWNAIGNIASKQDLDDIKNDLYANQRAWKVLIGVGVGAGVICMIGGIIGVHRYKKYKNVLKDSGTIESTTASPKSSSTTVSAYTD